jgi:hypothetical protein
MSSSILVTADARGVARPLPHRPHGCGISAGVGARNGIAIVSGRPAPSWPQR